MDAKMMANTPFVRAVANDSYRVEVEEQGVGRSVLASVHGSQICEEHGSAKEYAFLFAAAPLMLEALRYISQECAETPAILSEAALGIIQIAARTAISKAEGK